MRNEDDPADKLRALRASFAAGNVGVDEVYSTFEGLTFSLPQVPSDIDGALRDLVNDIELARHTLLPPNRAAAIDAVLEKAQPLFDERSV